MTQIFLQEVHSKVQVESINGFTREDVIGNGRMGMGQKINAYQREQVNSKLLFVSCQSDQRLGQVRGILSLKPRHASDFMELIAWQGKDIQPIVGNNCK